VWLGVSIATQADAEKNIPVLLRCPAAVRFVSAEPLIGPVDLSIGLGCTCSSEERCSGACPYYAKAGNPGTRLGWVIVGGESGGGARECDVAWVRSIVEQCKAASVPVRVKQIGARPLMDGVPLAGGRATGKRDKKGSDMSYWPADVRVCEWPKAVCGSLHPNPECETCVGAQLAREVARLPELKELEED